MKIATRLIPLLLFLAACQSAIPLPDITAETGSEFTLGISQSATIPDTGLTITLEEVTGDNRCPGEVECVESGFVTLVITVQKDTPEPAEFTLKLLPITTASRQKAPLKGFETVLNMKDTSFR